MNTEDYLNDLADEPAAPRSVTKTHYEAHYNDAGRVIWERIEAPVSFTPEQVTEQPKLNRAGRRDLRRFRYIRAVLRCARCAHAFLGSSADRCQCKATIKGNGIVQYATAEE